MRHARNFKLDWNPREKPVDQIYNPKNYKERCSKFSHEVRSVEQMQNFQYSKTNQEICREYSNNISSAQLKYFLSSHLDAEEKGDSDKKNRERTRVYAI